MYSFTVQRLLQYTDGKARNFLVDELSDKQNVFGAKIKIIHGRCALCERNDRSDKAKKKVKG
jgi:hypothetical protein